MNSKGTKKPTKRDNSNSPGQGQSKADLDKQKSPVKTTTTELNHQNSAAVEQSKDGSSTTKTTKQTKAKAQNNELPAVLANLGGSQEATLTENSTAKGTDLTPAQADSEVQNQQSPSKTGTQSKNRQTKVSHKFYVSNKSFPKARPASQSKSSLPKEDPQQANVSLDLQNKAQDGTKIIVTPPVDQANNASSTESQKKLLTDTVQPAITKKGSKTEEKKQNERKPSTSSVDRVGTPDLSIRKKDSKLPENKDNDQSIVSQTKKDSKKRGKGTGQSQDTVEAKPIDIKEDPKPADINLSKVQTDGESMVSEEKRQKNLQNVQEEAQPVRKGSVEIRSASSGGKTGQKEERRGSLTLPKKESTNEHPQTQPQQKGKSAFAKERTVAAEPVNKADSSIKADAANESKLLIFENDIFTSNSFDEEARK